MARKGKAVNGEDIDMPSGVRNALVRTMDTIANRQPQHEALILRLARVGQLVEVENQIIKRREYAKRCNSVAEREMP